MTRPQVGDIIRFGEYGTAQAQHVLNPYTIGTENGVIEGTMPNNGIVTITPNTSDQVLNGFFASGSKVVGDANFVASNIPLGLTFFGVAGTRNNVPVTAGDAYNYFYNGTAVNFTTSETWKEVSSITIGNIAGTVRVSFGLNSSSSTGYAYGRVYINDVPRGMVRSVKGSTKVNFTEDFAVNAGDKISLYAYTQNDKYRADTNEFTIKIQQSFLSNI